MITFSFCTFGYTEDDSHLQPNSWRHVPLKAKYECELIGHVPSSLFSMTWADRDGESVNTVLHNNVDPEFFNPKHETPSLLPGPPDLIVMGHTGRKGTKERKSSIGTTADQALR